MASDPEAIVRQALRRTGCTQIVVGLFLQGFGGFLLALHLLRLDPSLRKMPLAGVIVLDLFGLGCVALGVALVAYAALFAGRRDRELLRRLTSDPASIASYQQIDLNTTVGGQTVRTTTSIQVTGKDGKTWQFMVPTGDVPAVLAWLGERTREPG